MSRPAKETIFDLIPDWSGAHCAGMDPELFFPERGEPTKYAKAACLDGCPARLNCLAYSLAERIRYGIWGGLSDQERRPLRLAVSAGQHPETVAREAILGYRTDQHQLPFDQELSA